MEYIDSRLAGVLLVSPYLGSARLGQEIFDDKQPTGEPDVSRVHQHVVHLMAAVCGGSHSGVAAP